MRLMNKQIVPIFLLLIIVLLLTSCSSKKEFTTADAYKKQLTVIANELNYKITNEKVSNSNYSADLISDNDNISIDIELDNEEHFNRFEIIAINPVEFDKTINIANSISRKEFKMKLCNKVIYNEQPFYNLEEKDLPYHEQHEFFRIDYLDFNNDYCIEYYSFKNDGETILSLSGLSK